ncbi:Prmt5 [Symbiodinium sp. CCMP2592]|nr:Prmt5 [Symbiodinium sp. CCMP2592]
MVLGAGRGPLVEAAVKAAAQAEVQVELYAVEKNPNAVRPCPPAPAEKGWMDIGAGGTLRLEPLQTLWHPVCT